MLALLTYWPDRATRRAERLERRRSRAEWKTTEIGIHEREASAWATTAR